MSLKIFLQHLSFAICPHNQNCYKERIITNFNENNKTYDVTKHVIRTMPLDQLALHQKSL